MPVLPIPSVNALVSKTANTIKNLRSRASTSSSELNPLSTSPLNHRSASKNIDRTTARYKKHTLHYVLKALGYLPTPFLEKFNSTLHGPNTKQYPHSDAHLRLILALSNKLKQPLNIEKLPILRQKFAADTVAMQAPAVWDQSDSTSVGWQDNTITNADDGEMTVRCYQHYLQNEADLDINKQTTNQQTVNQKNTDKTVMLFIHGGGFCIGDIDTHHEFCHAVCTQTGWSVVSVDYRLAPEHPAPTALRDCLSAYAWVAEHCHTLGALPSRIVLAGDSAGGCLAISVAQQVSAPDASQWLNLGLDNDKITQLLQSLPRPLAQLPLYPVTDIEAEHPSWALYGQGLLLDHNDVEVFDAAYMQQSAIAQSHPLVSPMYGNNTQMCPSYIVVAELDILRDEALVYAEELQNKGIKVETHTVLGAPHGFIHLMSVHQRLGDETDYIINEFGNFVRQLLTRDFNHPEPVL